MRKPDFICRCRVVATVAALAVTGMPAISQQNSAVVVAANTTAESAVREAKAKNVVMGGMVAPDDYIIGAGDILSVSVWKEPDASVPSVVVRPDGKIAMPLLKDVAIAGMTPAQAETAIAKRLAPIIHDAEVSIVVTAINSKKIYAMGAVKKEGPIVLSYKMTVLQALSEAGGLTEYAKRRKIYVLRTENGKTLRFSFDYDEVIRGEKMDQNIQLIPGDTIVVRE